MAINATFGTVEYRDGGVIAVPVIFGKSVTAPSKTIFRISHARGDSLDGMEYIILGEGTAYELVFSVPPDRSGSFRISAGGNVLKATGAWDTVTATAKDVPYGTVVPLIVDYEVPSNYVFGNNFDMLVEFNVLVTGWHANNTFAEVWIEEGARLGTPSVYKWTGANSLDIHAPVPDDLSGTDWQGLATPPHPVTPGTNNFSDDGTEWHGEEGRFFLIRIGVTNAEAVGVAQFSLRPDNPLRGPVS